MLLEILFNSVYSVIIDIENLTEGKVQCFFYSGVLF